VDITNVKLGRILNALKQSARTHRAQIGWVFCLIGLAATRSQDDCWRFHSCEVATLEHRPKTCLDHVRDAIRLTHDSIHTPLIKAFYQQLRARGKAQQVALTAAMRTLLISLNAMVKTPTRWNGHLKTCA
jgi:hypothetical protein